MKITMISNYLNHHQYPICMEFKNNPDIDFCFVATEEIEHERLALGYKDMNQESFVIRTYESSENEEFAEKLCEESDIVITGSAPEKYSKIRIDTNKLLFRYSERIFKKGMIYSYSPRAVLYMLRRHWRYRKKNVYLLCASAFAAEDFNRMGAYCNKTFKWGYFPEAKEVGALETKLDQKVQNSILWVGRFVEWKHPEYMIELVNKLRREDILFHISMIGNGPMVKDIERIILEEGLEKYIHLLGAMSPEDVRENMEKSDIFLCTSDFNEGWGAVVNEAMNSMCAVVASHAAGSVPFLINNEENGVIYQNGDVDELCKKVKWLLCDEVMKKKIQTNAYKTIISEWNVEEAVKRFINLSENLLNEKNVTPYLSGPCSRAVRIHNNWFKK